MNLWDRIVAPSLKILFFFGVLFLCACETESDLGLEELGVNRDNINVQAVEIPLDVALIRIDSINTTGNGIFLVGRTVDPNFGLIEANSYAELRPVNTNLIPDMESEFIDARLVLVRADFDYGTNENDQVIEVRELETDIRILNGNDSIPINRNQQDFYSFNFSETTELPIGTASIAADQDTIMIDLADFGEQFFNTLISERDSIFLNQEVFRSFFPGFALSPMDVSNGIISINANLSVSYFECLYTLDSVERSFRLSFDNVNATEDDPLSYFNVLFDSGSEPFRALDVPNSPEQGVEILYLQSLTGIFPRIGFDNYFQWLDSQSDILLNDVSLKLGPFLNVDPSFSLPSSIGFVASDSSGKLDLSDIRTDGPLLQTLGTNSLIPLLVNPPLDGSEFSTSIFFYAELARNDSNTSGEFYIFPSGILPSGNLGISFGLNSFALNSSDARLRVIYTTFD